MRPDVTPDPLLAVVAHELRSPIAAILGYEELLSEGLVGQVDDRAREALARIRNSARQLLTLTDGMHELAGSDGADVVIEDLDHAVLIRAMVERGSAEAEARRVTIDREQLPSQPMPGRGDIQTIENVLDAAFGAALKMSSGGTLVPRLVHSDNGAAYRILGPGIDPAIITGSRIESGAALRMRIAQQMARRLGGTIRVVDADGAAGIEILLPSN